MKSTTIKENKPAHPFQPGDKVMLKRGGSMEMDGMPMNEEEESDVIETHKPLSQKKLYVVRDAVFCDTKGVPGITLVSVHNIIDPELHTEYWYAAKFFNTLEDIQKANKGNNKQKKGK